MGVENCVENPLVSIIIITYNSSKYIIETLESVRNQSYTNIELIISDDCSTDDTVAICEDWLRINGGEFVDYKLIRVAKNTGIAPNCNRGVAASKGEWLKLCAGDDLLLPQCIENNINFSKNNQDVKIFISNMVVFLDNTVPLEILEVRRPSNEHIWNQSVSVSQQYEENLLEYFGNTPSYFINSKVFDIVKFDENLPFIEDYSFSLNALKAGIQIVYNDVDTVLYRVGNHSVSNPKNKKGLYNSYYKIEREFDVIYRLPFLPSKIKKREDFEFNRKIFLEKCNLNYRNTFCRIINFVTLRMNPYRFF